MVVVVVVVVVVVMYEVAQQEIWFKDTPEDGAKLAPKHVG